MSAATTNTAATTARSLNLNRNLLTRTQRKILDKSSKPPGWMYGIARQAKERLERIRRPGTPFFVGQKQVFLPNFRIALLRTPHLPPSSAQFIVPLSFNKLDLRDYLFHAYSISCTSIRSFIKLAPITRVEPNSSRDLPGKRPSYRPRATKKMMVSMTQPFVWPVEVEKEENGEERKGKFDGERFGKMEEERERSQKGQQDVQGRWEREVEVERQARRLLEGKERWKGMPVGLDEAGSGSGARVFGR